jgi:hypothetical protein
MKQILIDNIPDAMHARIESALTKAYNCSTIEQAIKKWAKQTVKNLEESELLRAKDAEAQAAIDGLASIDL